jgi:hypothetical protein
MLPEDHLGVQTRSPPRCQLQDRSSTESGSPSAILLRREIARSCREQVQQRKPDLLDDLVGAAYEGQWNGEAECLRGLKIDDQLDFGGLLHR